MELGGNPRRYQARLRYLFNWVRPDVIAVESGSAVSVEAVTADGAIVVAGVSLRSSAREWLSASSQVALETADAFASSLDSWCSWAGSVSRSRSTTIPESGWACAAPDNSRSARRLSTVGR